MRHLILTSLIGLWAIDVFAQGVHSDSAKIQSQINRITNLIASRNGVLADYNRSLTAHTGFFGTRDGSDEKNSTTILLNVVKSDNQILVELNGLTDTLNTYLNKQQQIGIANYNRSNIYIQKYNRQKSLNTMLIAGIGVVTALWLFCLYLLVKGRKKVSKWKRL